MRLQWTMNGSIEMADTELIQNPFLLDRNHIGEVDALTIGIVYEVRIVRANAELGEACATKCVC